MAEISSTTHNKQTEAEQEDEDYMGDLSKFIPVETSEIPKPKKLPPKTLTNSPPQPSTKKPKFQTWQEKKARKQHDEDEKTLENLQSAIPQSNIGFKLLKQMGYTPGMGLGKEGSVGREEPIGLEIRRSRAGIGREDPVKEKVRKERDRVEVMKKREEWKKKTEEVMIEDFEVRQKLQWRSKRVVVNYNKAKAVVDQLENREPVVEPVKDGDEEEEEEEEMITEEDLLELLEKLREDHCYCLFCGCQYESMEVLLSNCPGLNEDDH